MADSSVRTDLSLATNFYDNEFLRVELCTGLLFSKIALESRYQDKRDRNCRNARKAYDALLYFIPKMHNRKFTESEAMTYGLAQLKSELQQLGEEF